MGCDGGTIPKRHELVRTKQKPEKKDKDMERNAKWSHCSISQQALIPPIVACELGKLYGKESILEFLLDRSISDAASHIRNLKDVKELNLTANEAYDKLKHNVAGQYDDMQASPYICPVSGLEMNGRYKFCVLWDCGCVLSERAIKEVPSKVCHKCGKAFSQEDIVVLNAEEEADKLMLAVYMEARRERCKREKLVSKAKRKSEVDHKLGPKVISTAKADLKVPDSTAAGGSLAKKAKLLGRAPACISSLKHGNKAPADGRVEANEEPLMHTGSTKAASSGAKKPEKSAHSSKVYQSLFTSSKEYQGRPKDKTSHWITYNPYI